MLKIECQWSLFKFSLHKNKLGAQYLGFAIILITETEQLLSIVMFMDKLVPAKNHEF